MDTIYTTLAEIEGIALLDPTYDDCEIVECDGGFKFEKNNFQTEKFKNDVTNVTNVTTLTLDEAKRIVDPILLLEKDDPALPALLGGDEFKSAYQLLCRTNDALLFEYRTKLKNVKPSGVSISAFKHLESESESGGNESISSELICLVANQGKLFYDEMDGKAYVTANVKTRIIEFTTTGGVYMPEMDVEHTMLIGGKSFIDWLSFAYYTETKGDADFGTSASESAIKQACSGLNGIAKFEGEKHRAYLRVAQKNDDTHYIFMANEKMQTVEVTATGWRVLDKSPVKFYKPEAMQALPTPATGGDISTLWQFVNIQEKDRPLVLAWMLEAFRAETKKPVLAITGMQGSAKSSTHDKIRQLIDPNTANLRPAPKNREDIFVSAGCNWNVSFENVSNLSHEMQDAICTLATGGGYATRTLYTNNEETIINALRPVIINSIPTVVTAQDLTDRAIAVEAPPINAYIEDSEISRLWEQAKPSIFGALLDLFVRTLAKLPDVKLGGNAPRMADFTKLGEAMMQAQGHEAGTFTTLYIDNRTESIAKSLESSPVAVAICEMVEKHATPSTLVYRDTMSNLLTHLSSNRTYGESLPRSPRALGDALKRQSPALASYGILINVSNKAERINGTRGNIVEIRKGGNVGNVGNIENKVIPPENKKTENVERF
jgi:hypothetical protein